MNRGGNAMPITVLLMMPNRVLNAHNSLGLRNPLLHRIAKSRRSKTHAFGRNRKEASFEDEVGGGVARTFGRKKGNRSHSDFGSDSEFYEEHCISYDDKSQSSIPKVATPKHATSTQNATTQALDKNDKPISIGDHVRHAIHGVGTVVRIEKASGGHKVAVQFGANDIRTIIARFLLVV